jgi:hypothetical protein
MFGQNRPSCRAAAATLDAVGYARSPLPIGSRRGRRPQIVATIAIKYIEHALRTGSQNQMLDGPPGHPSTGAQQNEAPTQVERDMVRWTRAVAWFTGLLFLANVVSNFFIFQQWKVANDAQVDTREQLRAVVTLRNMQEVLVNGKDGKIIAYAFTPVFFNSGGTRTSQFKAWGPFIISRGEFRIILT